MRAHGPTGAKARKTVFENKTAFLGNLRCTKRVEPRNPSGRRDILELIRPT